MFVPSPNSPSKLVPQLQTVPPRKASTCRPIALTESFFTSKNGITSLTVKVVNAELFPGTASGLLVISVAVEGRMDPIGAVALAVTTRITRVSGERSPKFALTVPPSEVPGATQKGSQPTNVTPKGSTTDIVGLSAGPFKARAETLKFTYCVMPTGFGVATNDSNAKSLGVGVGVGVGTTPLEVQFRVTLPNSLFQPSTAIR